MVVHLGGRDVGTDISYTIQHYCTLLYNKHEQMFYLFTYDNVVLPRVFDTYNSISTVNSK